MRLIIPIFDEDGNVLTSKEYIERGQLDNINRVREEVWILFKEYCRKMMAKLGETTKDMFYSTIRRTLRNEGGNDDDNDQTPGGDRCVDLRGREVSDLEEADTLPVEVQSPGSQAAEEFNVISSDLSDDLPEEHTMAEPQPILSRQTRIY
ncbi:hypothetical protein Droror1_Dr00009566 [Drosera rotundifolia]